MSADPVALFAARTFGGIPAGATRGDLAWLEREHRWLAGLGREHARHLREAFLCNEILATMKETA